MIGPVIGFDPPSRCDRRLETHLVCVFSAFLHRDAGSFSMVAGRMPGHSLALAHTDKPRKDRFSLLRERSTCSIALWIWSQNLFRELGDNGCCSSSRLKNRPTCYRDPRWLDPEFSTKKIPKKRPPSPGPKCWTPKKTPLGFFPVFSGHFSRRGGYCFVATRGPAVLGLCSRPQSSRCKTPRQAQRDSTPWAGEG